MKKEWIIAVANTESDGVKIYKMTGTEDQVKNHMMKLVKEDKAADKEEYEYGTENKKEIEVQNDGTLQGYNCFVNYHIDYTAMPLDTVPTLDSPSAKNMIKVAETPTITKEMIENGFRKGVIGLDIDPNMEYGTVCRISRNPLETNWFYISGSDACEMNPEEYIKKTPHEDLVNNIYEILEEFKDDEINSDEYNFYAAVLSEIM